MVKSYAEWILRWRYLVVLLCVIVVALLASGGRFLTFKTDYRVFFSDDNPQLLAFEELQNTYTKTDNVLFVLAPKDGKVFTPSTLETVRWLTEASWQIPYSLRVDSLSNYQHTRAEGDDLVVADLVEDPAALDQQQLQDIRDISVNEPLLLHRLISPDARVTGVNVTIQLPDEGTGEEVPAITAHARDLVRQLEEQHPEIDVYLTGMVIMNNTFPEVSIGDQKTLIPIMFVVILLTLVPLLYSFRRLGAVFLIIITSSLVFYGISIYLPATPTAVIFAIALAPLGFLFWQIPAVMGTFLVIIFSILSAMGLAGWLGIPMTPPSASSPTIILTLAVADCVHVLVTFLHGMRKNMAKRASIVESLRINVQPIFLTSVTTIIGFMSMNFSDAPPFRDLGNIVAMGVGLAFIYSITFLPALMAILPVRVNPAAEKRTRMVDNFADFVVKRHNVLFWGMGIIVIALISFIPRNELNDEFVKYFDDSIDFRNATEFATGNLTGIYTIDYSLGNGVSGGINEPGFLRQVDDFAIWYRQQDRVLHVNTLTDIMRRLNKNMHADDPDWYRLPEQRDLAAQYLLLYEMSLPYGLDLNNQIDINKSATRLTVTLENISSNELLAIKKKAEDWLAENTPELEASGASPSVMFAYIGQRNIKSMLIGTSIALLLISLILVFALRSLKIGLISLLPNLAPAAMAFGLWGLLNGQVGLGLSIVMGLTLGIVVDDTVHFLSKYLRARREQGLNAADAVRYAFHTVGIALVVTTLVLIAGFMVLTQSGFKLNSDMGLLTSITIALALLADFLLLPPGRPQIVITGQCLLLRRMKKALLPWTGAYPEEMNGLALFATFNCVLAYYGGCFFKLVVNKTCHHPVACNCPMMLVRIVQVRLRVIILGFDQIRSKIQHIHFFFIAALM
jgi:predicted RND superfamily exporter protein